MKNLINSILVIGFISLMSSCYVHTYNVGTGAQTGVEVKAKNHYLIYGLAALDTSSPIDMAGGAENYTVTTKHTFVDGLISGITFGIYSPTTTTIQK